MKHIKWTAKDIPQQNGHTFLITGTGGLGFEAALALSHAGAEVIVAGRNQQKGTEAVGAIRSAVPSAKIRFEQVDLANLASIRAFGQRLQNQLQSLDVLINNAGIMATPTYQKTVDGFEVQFATNFLGAVALTAQVMPLLRRTSGSRVVMVSSKIADNAKIDFDDLQSSFNYKPIRAYAQSKLADLIFALELQRRSQAGGWGVLGLAAHPGIASTDLITNGPGKGSLFAFLLKVLGFLVQSPAQGSLPLLFAATSNNAAGGSYYGPDKFGGVRGHPTEAKIPAPALDQTIASRLWDKAQSLTGASF